MKIVVTGAIGFIATALLRHLAADRTAEIVAVSRRPVALGGSGRPVVADLSVKGWTTALPASADIVIHLAQSLRYKEFPGGGPDMVGINVDATAELLDWSRSHGVTRFVLASSGSVYDPSEESHREEDRCQATDMYSATKLAAEQIALCYASLFQVVVARVFSVYGPGQQRGLFRTVLDRVRTGEAVSVAGGVGPTLTPLYVDDAASLFVRLATEKIESGATIVNLAGEQRSNLRAIAETMGRIGDWSPRFDETPGQTSGLAADISLLRSLIPTYRFTTIEDGLRDMITASQGKQGSSATPIHERA